MNKLMLGILDDILKLKVEVSMYIYEDKYHIDLNTHMKSECILVCEEGKVYAHMRYNKRLDIESIDDVIYAVSSCRMGRSYGNSSWIKILEG